MNNTRQKMIDTLLKLSPEMDKDAYDLHDIDELEFELQGLGYNSCSIEAMKW